MWYRSSFTGKIINESSIGILNTIFGDAAIETFIEDGVLKEIEPPSVIDIFNNGGGIVSAATRYQEIHNCNIRTAIEAVKKIREDISNVQKKERASQWKRSIVKIASSEKSQDTDK